MARLKWHSASGILTTFCSTEAARVGVAERQSPRLFAPNVRSGGPLDGQRSRLIRAEQNIAGYRCQIGRSVVNR
jgi:hypothetical protein